MSGVVGHRGLMLAPVGIPFIDHGPYWDSAGVTGGTVVLSDDLHRAEFNGGSNWSKARVDAAKSEGNWYYEVVVESVGTDLAIGIAAASTSTTTTSGGTGNAGDGGRLQYFRDGRKRSNGVYASYGASYSEGDVVGIALAISSGAASIAAYKNGSSQGVMYASVAVPVDGFVPHVCAYGNGGQLFIPAAIPAARLPLGHSAWDGYEAS